MPLASDPTKGASGLSYSKSSTGKRHNSRCRYFGSGSACGPGDGVACKICGGWSPKGRRSLEGPIPAKYQLTETPSGNYLQRTEWNVRDSEGTVVFTIAREVTGGSLKTIGFAKKHGKPCVHIPKNGAYYENPALILQRFVEEHGIKTLNVAGSRESKEPGIHRWVERVLADAFFWGEDHPGMLGGPGEG